MKAKIIAFLLVALLGAAIPAHACDSCGFNKSNTKTPAADKANEILRARIAELVGQDADAPTIAADPIVRKSLETIWQTDLARLRRLGALAAPGLGGETMFYAMEVSAILARLRAVKGTGPIRFHIVDDPRPNGRYDHFNAACYPSGVMIIHLDLLRVKWAIAQGIARKQADPGFDLREHVHAVYTALRNDRDEMPDADAAGRVRARTVVIFRSMLAFVLGHELAHYTERHTVRKYMRLVNGDLTYGFSRKLELEADRVGLEILVAAGYDPGIAISSIAVMADLEGRRTLKPKDTHPLASERLRLARAWIRTRLALRIAA